MLFDYKLRNFNIRCFCLCTGSTCMGLLVIRSAAAGSMEDSRGEQADSRRLIGMAVAVALSLMDYHRILNFSVVIYIICCVGLVAVLIWGKDVNTAERWIEVPVIGQLQPSEFSKIGLIIFFAWFFDKYQEQINKLPVLGMAAVLFGIPILLILAEPNLSTSLITIMVFAAMIFAAGLSYKWIFGVLAVLTPLAGIFIYLLQYEMIPFLRGYQAQRILSFINPGQYQDANRQQDNSVMAIGSGQLWGKG